MSKVKIQVATCDLKTTTATGTKIYVLTTTDNKTYDSFEQMAPGEHEVKIKPNTNPQYNALVSKPKPFGGARGNPDEERRGTALAAAVALVPYLPPDTSEKPMTHTDKAIAIAKKFDLYIKNG